MNSVKGRLNVNNYRVWAKHGWYEEERVVGGEYRIDVALTYSLPSTSISLENTIDYEGLIQLIDAEMSRTHALIESSCTAIHNQIKSTYTIEALKTTVTKLSVPINNLESTSFSIEE